MGNDIRIDKWLWAVRLFKTRSLASEACKKGRIFINDQECKPSRTVNIGDKVEVKDPPVTYRYKILELADKRMGAKLVPNFIEDITPEDQKEILEMQILDRKFNRQRGLGRPTKKERRDIEKFRDEI